MNHYNTFLFGFSEFVPNFLFLDLIKYITF